MDWGLRGEEAFFLRVDGHFLAFVCWHFRVLEHHQWLCIHHS